MEILRKLQGKYTPSLSVHFSNLFFALIRLVLLRYAAYISTAGISLNGIIIEIIVFSQTKIPTLDT